MEGTDAPAPHFDRVVQAVDADLAAMARRVIARHLNQADPATAEFWNAPDSRSQHQMQWHQWGILTHTRAFLRVFDEEIPRLLREWMLWDGVDRLLSRTIDGVSRWQLLRVTVLLHDIGKFGARTAGRTTFHFSGHETLSGQVIRNELNLSQYGLTQSQIAYVARTAEDHFVLGLLRRRSREHGEYTLDFIESEEFSRLVHSIRSEHNDDFVEIGVLFVGDSLAKAAPDSGMGNVLAQNVVNLAAGRRYLELGLDSLSC